MPLNDTERYLNGQKSFNAHIGDTVTVLYKAKDFEAGWQSPWALLMDSYIGQVATVTNINENGICLLKNDDQEYPRHQGGWYFPYFVLSLVR